MSGADDLSALRTSVMDILGHAAVRGRSSHDDLSRIDQLIQEWKGCHSDKPWERILTKARGVLGMLNVTPEGDPLRNEGIRVLLEFKHQWCGYFENEGGGLSAGLDR